MSHTAVSPADADRGAGAVPPDTSVTPRPSAARWAALRPWLIGAVTLLVAGLALAAVHALTAELDYDAVANALAEVPVGALATAVVATALSYAAMVGYDMAALRHAAPRRPAHR